MKEIKITDGFKYQIIDTVDPGTGRLIASITIDKTTGQIISGFNTRTDQHDPKQYPIHFLSEGA